MAGGIPNYELGTVSFINPERTWYHTEIQSKQITPHAIVQPSVMQDKRPFDFRGDF